MKKTSFLRRAALALTGALLATPVLAQPAEVKLAVVVLMEVAQATGRRSDASLVVLQWQGGEPRPVYPVTLASATAAWPKR